MQIGFNSQNTKMTFKAHTQEQKLSDALITAHEWTEDGYEVGVYPEGGSFHVVSDKFTNNSGREFTKAILEENKPDSVILLSSNSLYESAKKIVKISERINSRNV